MGRDATRGMLRMEKRYLYYCQIVLDAVEAAVLPPPRRTHKLWWRETAETSAAFTIAWNAREDARRFMRVNSRDRTACKTLEDGVCECASGD